MPTSTPSSSSSSTSRSFVSMTGILVSVLCAAAVGGGLATLMHQQKEAALQHRLALFDTKLTELTATVAMLTTMTTGADTDTVSSNRRLIENEALVDEAPTLNRNVDILLESGGGFSVAGERDSVLFKERYEKFLERSTVLDNSLAENEEDATPLPENNLVCTPLRAWVLSGIFDNQFIREDSNRSIYEENAVGATEKYTMYKPTAKNILLCGGENVCPIPTEELGIFAGNRVYPVAGPTIGDIYSEWRNYMVLLDPVVIEDDNGSLTQYRSSFAYTEYDYTDDGSADGSSANQRVPEFPITGGTGRFGSASGSVKNLGYTVITNEATGSYEQYEGLQFNVCVPPPTATYPPTYYPTFLVLEADDDTAPKTTNPVLGPPKKSGKVPKASF